MKVLVVGSGGREHVLAWKLKQSPQVTHVFCAPGNAGTAADVVNIDINAADSERLAQFAKKEQIDLTVIGPEAPLVDGIVDVFKRHGLRVFGPARAAAALEGSKAFCKEIMRQASIPTADYRVFRDAEAAIQFVKEREETPLVVKADGLASGKGVTVCANKDEAIAAVQLTMKDLAFGDAGKTVVIEEKLVGQEVSVMALVDGRTIVTLEAAQDHKAAYDGDLGPNTGGMGVYTTDAMVDRTMQAWLVQHIAQPTIDGMAAEDIPFTGVLYCGLMMTARGPMVLEYNARFGDPETQVLMLRLKSDLLALFQASRDGTLGRQSVAWSNDAALTVVMAANGYPGDYQKGTEIRGVELASAMPAVTVFHAGTKREAGCLLANGGRVLNVAATGATVSEARDRAYAAIACIDWPQGFCRSDIGWRAVERERG